MMKHEWQKPILLQLEGLAKGCECGWCICDGEKQG